METNLQVVSAQQQIFTRVEIAHSLKGKSGFQTYYASSGLSAADKAFIEAQVKSYDTKHPTCRYQFFFLPDGRAVVTHSRTVVSDKEINDREERGGMYIAHCLVFSKEDFALLQNDPFWVIDHYDFLDDVRKMVQLYAPQTGKERPVHIPLPTAKRASVHEWANQAGLFVQLSEKYFARKAKRPALFMGSPDSIERALRALIYFTQPVKRPACTFNLHVNQSSIQQSIYAFLGSPRQPNIELEYIVDADAKRCDMPPQTRSSPDLYVTWVANRSLTTQDMEHLATIQELGYAFTSRAQPRLEMLTEEGAAHFTTEFSEIVETNLYHALKRSLSCQFAHLFARQLMATLSSKIDLVSMAASGKVDFSSVALYAREWLIHLSPQSLERVKKKYAADLRHLAETGSDSVLLFWVLGLVNDYKHARSVLEKMSQGDYRNIFRLAQLPPFKNGKPVLLPEELIHPRYSSVMTEQMTHLLPDMRDEDFYYVVKRMVELDQTVMLGGFLTRIQTLNNQSLTRLEKLLRKTQDVPTAFSNAMQIRRKILGPEDTFFNRITGKSRSK